MDSPHKVLPSWKAKHIFRFFRLVTTNSAYNIKIGFGGPSVSPSVSRWVSPSVRPSVRPSVCLSVCLSVRLSVYLSVSQLGSQYVSLQSGVISREFQSKTFTTAFGVMCIGGIFPPFFDTLCKRLKDHFAVKDSIFQLVRGRNGKY